MYVERVILFRVYNDLKYEANLEMLKITIRIFQKI